MKDLKQVITYIELLEPQKIAAEDLKERILNGSSNPFTHTSLHPGLILQLSRILKRQGVIASTKMGDSIDHEQAKRFFELVDMAVLSRDHTWSPIYPRPTLFASPPALIPRSLAADINDIRNLLHELVQSAATSVTILSPYTNAAALQYILRPLVVRDDVSKVAVRVFIANPLDDARRQIKSLNKLLPPKLVENMLFYYRSDISQEEDSILHAKILLVDNASGYLGSANFTSQGLERHFELGVALTNGQAKLAGQMLDHLVAEKVFLPV